MRNIVFSHLIVVLLLILAVLISGCRNVQPATTTNPQPEPEANTEAEEGTITASVLPPLPESETLTFRIALERAFQYVTATTGMPREQLLVDNEQGAFVTSPNVEKPPLVLDLIRSEEVYYFHIVDESWDLVYLKLIVDSRGNVMDYRDYMERVSEHYWNTAGKINLGLYLKLRDMEPQETINVKIFLNDKNFENVLDFLESESANVTSTTGTFGEYDYRIIYATLPAGFVLSLAHHGDISEIEEQVETFLP